MGQILSGLVCPFSLSMLRDGHTHARGFPENRSRDSFVISDRREWFERSDDGLYALQCVS